MQTNQLRLGLGNALEAWGYSAAYVAENGPMNKPSSDSGEFNLQSAHPEAAAMGETRPYELPNTINRGPSSSKCNIFPALTIW